MIIIFGVLKMEYEVHQHREEEHEKKDELVTEILRSTNLDFSSVERQHSRESFDDVVHGNMLYKKNLKKILQ